MEKRGLSDVVTTVLIILLGIVAVAIVWVLVQNFVKDSTEKIELDTFTASVDVVPGSVKAAKIGTIVDLSLLVKRGGEGEELTALNVIVEDDAGNSKTYKHDLSGTPLKAFETAKVTTSYSGLNGKVSKITVIPVITKEGKEMEGSQKGIYRIQPGDVLSMPTGLVGYWKFDDDFSDGGTDDSAGSLMGTIEGDVVQDSGSSVSGKSAAFNDVGESGTTTRNTGGNIKLNPPSNSNIDLSKKGTLIAWVKPTFAGDSTAGYFNVVIGGHSQSNSYIGYALSSFTDNSIALFTSDGGKFSWARTTDKVPLNQWSMIAAGFDDINYDIYLNGVKSTIKNPLTLAQKVKIYSGVRRIGVESYKDVNTYFNGNIDEVMIFDKKLSDAEIASIYDYFRASVN